jgi:hypothetical protein
MFRVATFSDITSRFSVWRWQLKKIPDKVIEFDA